MRDAVDAIASRAPMAVAGRVPDGFRERCAGAQTSGANADGKTVWSWHPLLMSSLRRSVGPTGRGHVAHSPTTVTRRIRHRGARYKPLKPLRVGTPGESGGPVVTTLVCFLLVAREAAGASGTRCSPRPLFSEALHPASLGQILPRECGRISLLAV